MFLADLCIALHPKYLNGSYLKLHGAEFGQELTLLEYGLQVFEIVGLLMPLISKTKFRIVSASEKCEVN